MKKIIVSLLVFLIIIVPLSILIYQHLSPTPLKLPYFSPNPQDVLTDTLAKNGLPITGQIIVQGPTLEASISGFLVYFSSDKDLALQARTLQLVLPRLKMDTKTARVIDLRFNKVVIRY